jgi:hypothetical protein
MLIVFYAECHIQALYAECHYVECRYSECSMSRFILKILLNLFHKTSYLKKEVNCTEPYPSVSIPWTIL